MDVPWLNKVKNYIKAFKICWCVFLICIYHHFKKVVESNGALGLEHLKELRNVALQTSALADDTDHLDTALQFPHVKLVFLLISHWHVDQLVVILFNVLKARRLNERKAALEVLF